MLTRTLCRGLLGRLASLLLFAAAAVTANAQVIYDNGGFATGTTTRSGVAAPAGAQWSEAQNNSFDITSANTNAGIGCQTIGTATENRCADDFVVPPGETWTITGVTVFVYQTGFAGAVSPVTASTLQIWNAAPGLTGSTVIFGDTTTNRLGTSTDTNTFRIFNTTSPPPGSAPGTTRRVWSVNMTVSPGLVLGPGHYWIDFSINAGANGNFTVPTTIVGARATSIWNGRQRTGAAPGTWATFLDDGNPAAAPNVPQDFPFKLSGTIAGSIGPRRARVADFIGDSRSDFSIARTTVPGGQSQWWTRDAAGAVTVSTFGLNVGAAGDRPVPEDFDGDGRSDIAVWRPGAATQAAFYIIRSSDSTLRIEPFGQTGDDPSVVDDYDGDGSADPAVYRNAAAGQQSFFFYRGSLNNPSRATTYVPWGIGNDKAVPGDYDGDRRADYAVVRNSGGNAQWYFRLATGTVLYAQFGLFTDKFAPGDYDGDNKTDPTVVRANGSLWEWYVLRSTDGSLVRSIWSGGWGNATTDDIVQGDYDGDNRTDFAVWRRTGAEAGTFFIAPSNSALITVRWGQEGDTPVAGYNVR